MLQWRMMQQNQIQIAALIITFNPNISDLKSTLPEIMNQTSYSIIVDNNSKNITQIERLTDSIPGCILIKNNTNHGIAFALNQGFREAILKKVDWVITLDDDSIVPAHFIERLTAVIPKNPKESEKLGIVCPLLRDKRTGLITHSKKSNSECITSGSLTNVQAWESINGFDEWLFIDGVDFDFSRRLVQAGYTIKESEKALLLHEIGNTIPLKVFGIQVGQIMSHTATRKYYQERNYPYIDKKLGSYNSFTEFLRFLKHLLLTSLFEVEKMEKVHAILRGRHDAMTAIHALDGDQKQ